MKPQYLQYQLNVRGLQTEWNVRKTKEFKGYCVCRKREKTDPDQLRIEADQDVTENGILIGLDDCGWIAVKGIGLGELSRCLNEIFSDYEKWKFARENADGIQISSLLEVAGDILHTVVVIINNEYRYIAKNSIAQREIPEEYVSEEDVARVTWEKEFFSTQNNKEDFCYLNTDTDISMMCHNIFFHDLYYARLIAYSAESEISGIFMELFHEIAIAVEARMKVQGIDFWKGRKNQKFVQQMEKLLDQENVTDTNIFAGYGWEEQQEYQVIRFRIFYQYPIMVSGGYLQHKIESNFTDCCVLRRENDYVCIRNLSLSHMKDLHGTMAPFLREHFIKAGISNPFTGISKLAVYDMQTMDALNVGMEKDPDFWYFRFKDYAFEIFMKYGNSRYPLKELLHPAIFILKNYDELHQTELLKTLKVYLELNENASHAAETLNIQRSSLLKRLKRIEELSKTDITAEHLYLSVSCHFIM